MTTQKKQQGFTIIEVVLVLAIAGLIFLMVFIALPALQRNQRDTQRRNDAGRLVTAVNNYQTNTKGNIPLTEAAIDGAVTQYLSEGFIDPSEGNYNVNIGTAPNAVPARGVMLYYPGSKCSATTSDADASGGARQFAIRITMEGGGVYCTGT